MARREMDQYYTPDQVVREFLDHFPEVRGMRVCEPCAGDGAISKHLPNVVTYDLDPKSGHPVADARTHTYYGVDCFVSNLPFNQAALIVHNLLRHELPIYVLLRLTFLEPVEERNSLLNLRPPDEMLITPRISFTGDGSTDSVTTAWMCWNTPGQGRKPIRVVYNTRFDRRDAVKAAKLAAKQVSV